MKKILILLFAVSIFSSCSDDDETTMNEDQILGTWNLVAVSNVPFAIDECTSQSYITFMADNTADSEFFSNTGSGCVSETSSGSWSSSDNSQYSFQVPTLGQLTGTVNFVSDTRFTFTPNDLPASSLTFEK